MTITVAALLLIASIFALAASISDWNARIGLSAFSMKNFSSSAFCASVRFVTGVARIVLRLSGKRAPSSVTAATDSEVTDSRKRPMLCWLIAV